MAGGVGERIREGNQVEEVVGVQVRDHDRVDRRVVAVAAKLREDAVAAVEQHGGAVLFDQVAAARSVRVLPGRRFPRTVSLISLLDLPEFRASESLPLKRECTNK